jgi:ribonuclease G
MRGLQGLAAGAGMVVSRAIFTFLPLAACLHWLSCGRESSCRPQQGNCRLPRPRDKVECWWVFTFPCAMSEEILINFSPLETRVAVMAQGVVQEIHIERTVSQGLVGNIYLGKINRILPGMQSAFIEVNLERTAFLHVADIRQARDQPERPIEKILSEGQSLMVQVIKDPIGTKGARLSTQISLAGRMLVHLPQDKHIGISQRIEDAAEREALRSRLAALVPEEEAGGFIVRTMAENATDAELQADIAYLRKLWRDIQDKARVSAAPSLLYRELNLGQRVLRDFVHAETSRIVIDTEKDFAEMQRFASEYTPTVTPLLELYTSQRPLFDLYGVEDEIEKALARRVDLKSGGYLIIDQTEAMTTIDVNTGGFVGIRNFDDTVFKTNLEAAQSIARQLCLRNLGGIIIVDFIDMENTEHRQAVLSAFNKALERDHTRLTVNGFTALGLVEMTRKRTRESLAHILCETCPTCGGRGEIKTARTVAYGILRELLREARQFEAQEYRILASPQVIDLFLDEESQSLATLSDFIGKTVSLQAEGSYAQEQYDIVLL